MMMYLNKRKISISLEKLIVNWREDTYQKLKIKNSIYCLQNIVSYTRITYMTRTFFSIKVC